MIKTQSFLIAFLAVLTFSGSASAAASCPDEQRLALERDAYIAAVNLYRYMGGEKAMFASANEGITRLDQLTKAAADCGADTDRLSAAFRRRLAADARLAYARFSLDDLRSYAVQPSGSPSDWYVSVAERAIDDAEKGDDGSHAAEVAIMKTTLMRLASEAKAAEAKKQSPVAMRPWDESSER